MTQCKHSKPQFDNFGKCQKVQDFLAKGATRDKTEQIIRDRLNGAVRMPGGYMFENCDESRQCQYYEPR
jgi:hypothetical protein